MNGTTKFIIGAVATSLMAMASHSLFGLGGSFIDRLGEGATAAVTGSGVPGVSVAMDSEPTLNRVAVLSGTVSDADRAKIEAAVLAVPGIKGVRWADGSGAAAAAPAATTPEAPATVEAVKDCQSDVDAVIKGKTIQFDSGAATIKPESQALIDALAGALTQCAGTKVEVAGHTDLTGNDAANMRLSEERANSVVAALVAKAIPADRLLPKGYGETKPVQPGMTAAANAANRRIEFSVASAAPAAAPAE